jgi:hypothetical protein
VVRVLGLGEEGLHLARSEQAGHRVDHAPLRVEHVVDAVARDRALEPAATAHVDRDAGHGALARPVQDVVLAEVARERPVRVQHHAEVAAVRTGHLFVEATEHAEREDRSTGLSRLALRGLEVGVPVEARGVPVALAADDIA